MAKFGALSVCHPSGHCQFLSFMRTSAHTTKTTQTDSQDPIIKVDCHIKMARPMRRHLALAAACIDKDDDHAWPSKLEVEPNEASN